VGNAVQQCVLRHGSVTPARTAPAHPALQHQDAAVSHVAHHIRQHTKLQVAPLTFRATLPIHRQAGAPHGAGVVGRSPRQLCWAPQ
jgi:hypothetical protein